MTVDLTPEAVEAHILRVDPYKMAQPRSLNADTFALLRALSARLAEVEARPSGIVVDMAGMPPLPPEAFDPIKDIMIEGLIKGGTEWRHRAEAAEAALATARADALREAAAVAEKTGTCLLPSGSFLSERCRDAILAIIPKEKPNDR